MQRHSEENVLNTIEQTDSILQQDETTTVYSKITEENSKSYLYRVFVNVSRSPALVITTYKTSKIEKYGY